MDLTQMRRPYVESGSLSSMSNTLGFIDEKTLLMKGGELAVFVEFRGRDAESTGAEAMEAIVSRFKTALLAFDERFVITEYLLKRAGPDIGAGTCENEAAQEAINSRNSYLRSKAGELFSFETYLIILCKPDWRNAKSARTILKSLKTLRKLFRRSLTTSGQMNAIDETLEATKRHLYRGTQSFLEQTADILSGRLLGKHEAFRLLRRLLNPSKVKAEAVGLISDCHVDYFAADSVLEGHPGHLRLDDYFVKTLTLKELPSHTQADLLRELLRVSGDLTVVLEWTPLSSARGVSLIRSKRRYFHHTKSSPLGSVTSERPIEREILFDESKEALVSDLGRCLEDIELNGLRLGELSLSVVLTGKTLEAVEQATAETLKVFGTFEAALNEERYNGLNAFQATLPGGYPFNLRKLVATNQNHADLSFLFLPSEGEKVDRFLNAESLISFETQARSLFGYGLHSDDVGHTNVAGRTGGGKSFLLACLNVHAQKYKPITLILDVGGSYESPIQLLGGSYVRVRPDAPTFSINPFSLEPTPKNLQFLHSFVKVLVESGGERLSSADDRELFDAIGWVYVLDPEQRRLLTLSTTLGRALGERLRPWTEGEQYGRWFDKVSDNVTFAPVQCIDFEGMDRLGPVLEPLLFYLLYRFDQYIYDPALATTFKLITIDELWRLLKHPITRAYIIEALRTWRKKNAAVLLATQAVEDFSQSPELRAIVDNCPTKLLFANETADGELYRDVFGLSEQETERVRSLTPKKQFLLKREGLSKVLDFNVDPRSYWLFTTNPFDVEKRQRAINERGSLRAALDYLTGESK